MSRERLLAILAKAMVIALIFLLVWEMVSITLAIRSIESNLSSIETRVAPNGQIDQSLDSIDSSLSSIETEVAPGGQIDESLDSIK